MKFSFIQSFFKIYLVSILIYFLTTQLFLSHSTSFSNNDKNVILNKTDCHLDLKKYREIPSQNILNKHADKVRFFNNQALTLFALGNFTQAIQYYNKILCIESNATDALIGKADNLAQLERYDEAIFFYNRA